MGFFSFFFFFFFVILFSRVADESYGDCAG